MISLNTEKLKEATKILDKIQNGVKKAYNCDWNDPVHDSFDSYLSDSKKHEERIRASEERIYAIVQKLEAMEGGEQIGNEACSIKNQIMSI